jgi:hypothetical protein
MTEPNHTLPKKRGPKPVGETAMSTAERQRRRREQLRATGGKGFLLELEGLRLQYVEELAQSQGLSTAAALRLLVDQALLHSMSVMHLAARMAEDGATDEACGEFIGKYLYPTPPAMPQVGAAEK